MTDEHHRHVTTMSNIHQSRITQIASKQKYADFQTGVTSISFNEFIAIDECDISEYLCDL